MKILLFLAAPFCILLVFLLGGMLFGGTNPQTKARLSTQISRAPSGLVQEAWVARYNGPGDYEDRANAIVTDNSGNVYVTGFSWGSGTGPDYATIKYNSDGQEQWIARYDGPSNFGEGNRGQI